MKTFLDMALFITSKSQTHLETSCGFIINWTSKKIGRKMLAVSRKDWIRDIHLGGGGGVVGCYLTFFPPFSLWIRCIPTTRDLKINAKSVLLWSVESQKERNSLRRPDVGRRTLMLLDGDNMITCFRALTIN